MAKKTAKKKTNGAAISRPAGKASDLRPVRDKTARATVVRMGAAGSHTVEAIAKAIKKDRRTILLHLFLMNRDCGIGYSVAADGKVKLSFPTGRTVSDAIKGADR